MRGGSLVLFENVWKGGGEVRWEKNHLGSLLKGVSVGGTFHKGEGGEVKPLRNGAFVQKRGKTDLEGGIAGGWTQGRFPAGHRRGGASPGGERKGPFVHSSENPPINGKGKISEIKKGLS